MQDDNRLRLSDEEDSILDEEDHYLYGTKNEWKVIIADDDEDVHILTKMVLKNFKFEDKKLKFLSAYSGRETITILEKNPDTAIIFLDVVMETENSGLEVIKYIRKELKNIFVRIILRTGHPGQAPEEEIIKDYDINDYKEKTELTSKKLLTTLISSLRAYSDLKIIEKNRKGLEKIIQSASTLFEVQSFKKFTEGVLTQLISILNLDANSLYLNNSGFAATETNRDYLILSATGEFKNYQGKTLKESVSPELYSEIQQATLRKQNFFSDNAYIGYFETFNGSKNMIYMQGNKKLSDLDKKLILTFASNISTAFDNIFLNKKIREHNRNLEQLVAERTAELEEKNRLILQELEMAKRVQLNIIPKNEQLPHRKDINFSAEYMSLESIGGDLYDVIQLDEHKFAFFIADVSGHGVPSALITTMAKVSFSSNTKELQSPKKIYKKVNEEMYSLIGDLEYYLTAFYGIIDLKNKLFTYSNAGHPPAFYYNEETKKIEKLDTTGTIIGAYDDCNYEEDTIKIKKGDKIILYTDGIIETKNANMENYGYDRLKKFFMENHNIEPKLFISKILKDLENYCGLSEPCDDKAILYIEITE